MDDASSKNKSFMKGAVILGFAGIAIKVLGAAFRIPLTNIIGDDGMGYYQTAYPIYNLFLTLAVAGIPTAIAKMVAERLALERPGDAHRVFRVSFGLLFVTGAVTSSLLFFGAGAITSAIHEPGAVYCMRAIAPALLFCPLMSAFRGYFQGRQDMGPTALSQIAEQLFRVGIGLGLAIALLPKGVGAAAAGASFGATAGAFFGFLCIGKLYLMRRRYIISGIGGSCVTAEPAERILRDMLMIAVPITIGSAVLPVINTIDTAIVKTRLISVGCDTDTARALYGQLTGMAAPLLNFPQVMLQGVSMSLVPVIASAHKRAELGFMRKNVSLAMRYASVLSIPCAVGMSVLAEPIMLLFYPRVRDSAISASGCLVILAWGVIFLGFTHTCTGILQGVGRQMLPVRNLCIGALAKIALTYALTGIPSLNVRGAAISTVAAYFTAAFLDFADVKRYTGADFDIRLTLIKPAASAAVMGLCARASCAFLSARMGNAASTCVSIALGMAVYAAMILATKGISVDEIEALPKGKRTASALRRFIR